MISVLVCKQGNYPVNTPKIKKFLRDFFSKNGIVSDAEVSVLIAGEKKMKALGKKYLDDNLLHSVLSFTSGDVKSNFVYPPDKIYLGEIVVCYPKVVEEAKKEGKLIDSKVNELLQHAGEHLLGRHHE